MPTDAPQDSSRLQALQDACVDRFLRYVRIDTTAAESSDTYPSTPGQLELLRLLRDELDALGLDDVVMDEHGTVTATVPASIGRGAVPHGAVPERLDLPAIGFIAHVDTSPDVSGADVKPIVHRDYDGRRIVLPDEPTPGEPTVLDPADDAALAAAAGHTIVTASGTTLLGGDDKAGVAEIVAAAEYLLGHPEIPYGPIRLAFTPDEEVGRSTQHFDVEAFGARCAYTLDGGGHGEVEIESFAADSLDLTFRGHNVHPGYAKGILVNAVKVAADFLGRLPADRLSPETTDGMDGYVHPNGIEGSVEQATIRFLLRSFDADELRRQETMLRELAAATVADWPGATFDVVVSETYRNMREVLDRHPEVVEIADEAMRRVGLEPGRRPIRGGTDGSKLSFDGLPTPNLSSGQHAIHSRREWVDAWEMGKAAEVIVEICRLFGRRATS
ncbi:MAG: peptidase T [Acidobacteriota bacterium]